MTGPVKTARRLAIVPYDAPGLGDRSYMVHDGAKAVVVDPQRDPAPYLATAEELGVEITWVLETHVHNDYVSGGLALARRTKASYGIPAGEPVDFAGREPSLGRGRRPEHGFLDNQGAVDARPYSPSPRLRGRRWPRGHGGHDRRVAAGRGDR